MLVLSRRPQEEILIGHNIVVKVLEVRGNQVKLGIQAPVEVEVDRAEVRDRKEQEAAALRMLQGAAP